MESQLIACCDSRVPLPPTDSISIHPRSPLERRRRASCDIDHVVFPELPPISEEARQEAADARRLAFRISVLGGEPEVLPRGGGRGGTPRAKRVPIREWQSRGAAAARSAANLPHVMKRMELALEERAKAERASGGERGGEETWEEARAGGDGEGGGGGGDAGGGTEDESIAAAAVAAAAAEKAAQRRRLVAPAAASALLRQASARARAGAGRLLQGFAEQVGRWGGGGDAAAADAAAAAAATGDRRAAPASSSRR